MGKVVANSRKDGMSLASFSAWGSFLPSFVKYGLATDSFGRKAGVFVTTIPSFRLSLASLLLLFAVVACSGSFLFPDPFVGDWIVVSDRMGMLSSPSTSGPDVTIQKEGNHYVFRFDKDRVCLATRDGDFLFVDAIWLIMRFTRDGNDLVWRVLGSEVRLGRLPAELSTPTRLPNTPTPLDPSSR